ncbi:tyrosinase 2 [Botrytis cinerea]
MDALIMHHFYHSIVNFDVTRSLYIQALLAMQAANEYTDGLSYFQLAGIHGRPYVSWDGVNQTIGAPVTGYCTHDSVLFTTWHRPYLALFEQVLASYAQKIAKTYISTLYPAYQAAADNLRIPFWDWGVSPSMPSIINVPTVSIVLPSGTTTYVNNPLFPTISSWDSDGYMAQYNWTVRNPDYSGDGQSDFNAANMNLENAGLGDQVWTAIMKSSNFNSFATMAVSGASIESPHGAVHVLVGGSYGHMSFLSYSGFDPIFWLHHANVDRVLSMYQAINPSTFITLLSDWYGTYTIPPGTIDTASSPLKPFAITSSTFFTSNTCRSMSQFGYSYPEIMDWNMTAAEMTSYVIGRVNELYNSDGSNSKIKKRNFENRELSSEEQHEGSSANKTLREWTAALSVSKLDLQGQRFIIRLFLGEIPEDPEEWGRSESLVGSLVILPPPGAVSNEATKALAYDEIVILREPAIGSNYKAHEEDGDREGTEEFLKRNLRWRAQLLDNAPLHPTSLPTLKIIIGDEVLAMPYDITKKPVYGTKTLHPDIVVGGN